MAGSKSRRPTEAGDLLEAVEVPAPAPWDSRRHTPLPSIPETGWTAPREFPRLSSASVIAFDTETKDLELEDHGPGWARGRGHVIGLSVAVSPVDKWYFPIRHEVCPEQNLDPTAVLRWAADALGTSALKVGANAIYDVGWLSEEGVQVKGPIFDVQYAEALLREDEAVNLEHLSQKYLGIGKETSILYDWIDKAYGKHAEGKHRKELWRSPPSLVGPYAETDAANPLLIYPKQSQLLVNEGLYHILDMECSLIPFLVAMRRAGVTVDLDKAEALRITLMQKEQELSAELANTCGFKVNVNSSTDLAKVFDAFGIGYPKTEKGAPSFKKDFLEKVEHPIGDLIKKRREVEKLRSTFVEGYILNSHIGGKVYGQFHPLRGDSDGTRSGRFSSSTPNLQNLPSRDKILAPLTRGIFIPDNGHKQWRKYDYSQIEYRFLIHFAVGAGADEARSHFNQHPETDYHERALDLVGPEAGWDVATEEGRKYWRKPIKNINFGLIYGMGQKKLARSLGFDDKQARLLFEAYHRGVPFAKATMEATSIEAAQNGFITTYLGRRSRFDEWEPAERGKYGEALPYHQALHRYGSNIRRAHLHKALNRRLQGSAADMLKVACARLWHEGVFNYIGVPRLTVHDELDFSDPGNVDDGFEYMQHVLETCIPLRVPIKADGEVGPDWGHVH